jgi:hypothetical protein
MLQRLLAEQALEKTGTFKGTRYALEGTPLLTK